MVRINLIDPRNLADQHLVAEYDEILMLVAHVRKYPFARDVPEKYCLGKGHIRFFKNKLKYLEKRHELLKKEMKKRGFRAGKTVNLKGLPKGLVNDWKPSGRDKKIIRKRIIQKIKQKPGFYRYCKEHKQFRFFLELTKN